MNKLSSDSYLHPLPGQAIGIPLPVRFTYPFHYTPHPLVRLAAEEVLHYLSARNDWQEELQQGKMFGVLIVQQADGNCGYLAAFSGNLAGSNLHPFFVPPVYDLLQPDGFFRIEEANISAINRQIRELESSPEYQSCEAALRDARNSAGQELERARQELKNARALREARRREPLTPEEQEALIRESQFQKPNTNVWKTAQRSAAASAGEGRPISRAAGTDETGAQIPFCPSAKRTVRTVSHAQCPGRIERSL